MKQTDLIAAAAALAIALIPAPASAQHNHGSHGGHPELHVNPRWEECSFQLSAALTQSAWRQFTEEAGLVVYFRPLSDARPMGRGNFEVSAVRWETGIDDADPAWNDTFVHPDADHVLFEGSRLAFPGLMVRAGVTSNTDIGLYVTKSPGANYGFYGAQLQRSIFQSATGRWAGATRVSFVSMYGPEDLEFTVYGADAIVSRTITVARWASLSPYAGISAHLSTSHEKSAVVDLEDERVLGAQATLGAAIQLSRTRLAMEYNAAKVGTISFKVGVGL